jgi:hypothetical protein
MTLALFKDDSIKNVLNNLFHQFGKSNFEVIDYWDADLSAIGIKNSTDKKYLVYISTFNSPNDLFFVEVEKTNTGKSLTDVEVFERFEQIDFEKLSKIIIEYLFLQPNYEQ